MPFRRWFAGHGAQHPVAYSMATLALGVVVCMAVAVAISVQASNRAIRDGLATERAQREQARLATCLVIETMIDVYSEPTPATQTGRQAAVAWRDLGTIFGCKGK